MNCEILKSRKIVNGINYVCNHCLYYSSKKSNFLKHLSTTKHKKSYFDPNDPNEAATFSKKLAQNKYIIYCCKDCDYFTMRKNDYDKHILTARHEILVSSKNQDKLCNKNILDISNKKIEYNLDKKNENNNNLKTCNNTLDNGGTNNITPDLICSPTKTENPCEKFCQKKTKSSTCSEKIYPMIDELFLQKKTCKEFLETLAKKTPLHKNSIDNIQLSQKELDLTIKCSKLEGKIEALESSNYLYGQTINNITQTHNEVNYNDVNIHMYLNTHYKQAMNINEFVDKLQFSGEDIKMINDSGYTSGVSNILLKNLELLKEKERPIHCIEDEDKTKELYVKQENNWDKQSKVLDSELDKLKTKQCHIIKNDDEFFNMINTLINSNPQEKETIKRYLKNKLKPLQLN